MDTIRELQGDGEQQSDHVMTMTAVVQDHYGDADVLRMREVVKPVPQEDEVLIRVHASSVNAMDWHLMTGVPALLRPAFGFRRPKAKTRGADVAGTVEDVGSSVTRFKPGDEVFGEISSGAYAEYAVGGEDQLAHKPRGVSFEEVAAAPVAAMTALQGLRDVADVKPGDKVLINGASGGVGTYAVQIAKVLGAEVTAVCSARNVEMARSLGADHVIDYTKEDFTDTEEEYDVFFDIPGNRSVTACQRILAPGGFYLMVGGPKGRWLGPIPRLIAQKIRFLFGSKREAVFTAASRADDLAYLGELLESGAIKSFIEARYPLSEVALPLAAQSEFHARGKIVITV